MPLYQEKPLYGNNNKTYNNTGSFTASRIAFRNTTFLEYLIHERNPRIPNQEITLHYLEGFDIKTIKMYWKELKSNLDRTKLEYIATIEITRGRNKRANGCVHYQFIFDTTLSRKELKATMHAVCLNSGISEQHFQLDFPNKVITDWGERKIKYFTKNSKWKTVYLFEKGLRLRKFYHSKDWFLNENGEPTKKTIIREQIQTEYKKMKANALSVALAENEIVQQLTDPLEV
jgi:hypothetical protein